MWWTTGGVQLLHIIVTTVRLSKVWSGHLRDLDSGHEEYFIFKFLF